MIDRIPPEVRARLRDLRITSQRGAASGGLGQHVSRTRDTGLEFAQYRQYEPGDEPRRIDWRLYARSDRYFVRESERDAALTVWVLVDATASMGQPLDASRGAAGPDAGSAGGQRTVRTKLDVAKALAACLVELALKQGDRYGVITMSGAGLTLVPAASGSRQRDRCLLELDRVEAAGTWPKDTVVRPVWDRVSPGSLVMLLSDSFDEAPVELATRLSAARREVRSIQILTPDERDFPFRGGHRFVDPESAATIRVDAAAARRDFLARFAAARAALAARYAAARVGQVEYFTDAPLDQPLQRYFATRNAEARNA